MRGEALLARVKFRGVTDKGHQEPGERQNEHFDCTLPNQAVEISDLKQVYVCGEGAAVHLNCGGGYPNPHT